MICLFRVPTEWNKQIFESYLQSVGFTDPMVHVIPEAVDTDLFDRRSAKISKAPWSGNQICDEPVSKSIGHRNVFEFLSIFKWERRKGWDLLLDSYWGAFSLDDEVVLRLHTYVPSWVRGETNVSRIIEDYAYKKYGKPLDSLAAVVWERKNNENSTLSRADIRDLYVSADAFVLPTRGEGWGLPIAEAMAMELPVIVSNFSGPAVFANVENAYLIPMTGEFDELGFATPDVDALKSILRQVVKDSCSLGLDGKRSVAAKKAEQARADIAEWSPSRVVDDMTARIKILVQQRGYF